MKNLSKLLQGGSADGLLQSSLVRVFFTAAIWGIGAAIPAGAQTPLAFVPVTPCRVADTRLAAGPFGAPSIAGQATRNFTIPSSACSIPATAQAYSLNVAVVPQATLGYLTMWPTGQAQPVASTLNSVDGRVKSNAAIIPAGTSGAISVFASNTTDVVLDIDGYFVPATTSGSLAFYPLAPCRIADTRNPVGSLNLGGPYISGQQTRAFPVLSSTCNVPATAQSYSLNFTAVPRGSLGYLTTWATGQAQPVVSTLNATTGTVTANAAVVPAGTSGSINVFASNDTDLAIDINGYFAPQGSPGALALYAVTPCRVFDSRLVAGAQPFSGNLNIAVAGSSCAPPATAQSYVFNATVVPQASFGYLTLYGHGATQPLASTLNAIDGVVTGNLAIVPTTDGSITAFASNTTQLIMDLSAYFAPAPTGTAPVITDFNPKTGPVGTLITLTGTGLSSATVALAAVGGGTITAPLSTTSATGLTFVIPAGAATGPLTVSANGLSATSTASLTLTPSSNFTISAVPASANLIMGQSVSYSVQLASASGFTQLAPLSVTGLPSGVTAAFKPTSITAGQTSILTLTAPATQAAGSTTMSIAAAATVDGIPLTQTAPASVVVQAPTTSFLGRAVGADNLETPLAGVTVTMLGLDGGGNTTACSGATVSDASGNFALTNLAAGCVGPQLIGFGGTKVVSPPGTYAGVQLVFTLVSGKVVVSPVLVHLPRIDNVETFMVTQNATVDQSYTFKTIPNLSVTVYAGTVLTEQDGTQPNPFPLAAVQVPVDRLPDVMPATTAGVAAFIVAFQPAEATSSKAVPVWFPNTLNSPPGTSLPLMTLDPTRGRMVPYGTGTVSSDGTTVIPDIDPSTGSLNHRFGLVHFDWHGPLGGPPNENDPPPDPNGPSDGDPVDLASGINVITSTDIAFGGTRGGVSLTRTARTLAVQGAIPGPFGWGSYHNFDYRLDTLTPQSAAVINLILPNGTRIPFTLQVDGTLRNSTVPMVAGWRITPASDGTATLTQKSGVYYKFAPGIPPTGSVLVAIGDPNGNVTTIVRASGAPYQITEIDDPAGRKLQFQYSGYSISQISDPIGRTVSYTYNSAGYLATFTNVLGGVTSYQYDSQNRFTQITDPRGVVTKTAYDANGRVSSQTLPSGGTMTFGYTLVNSLVPTSPVTQTIVTDPLGNATTYRFNTQGFLVGVTDATGQVRTFTRQNGTNFLLSATGNGVCNKCGATTAGNVTYTYDASGNKLTETDALGFTVQYAYDPVYNRLVSVTDKAGNLTAFAYDSNGNPLKITDPRGGSTTFAYAAGGLVTSATDAAGRTTSFAYDSSGNLIKTTDPLGVTTQLSFDGISRPVASQDGLGAITSATYNAMGELATVVEANGRTTKLTYDTAGFLKSYTDPNGGTVSFGYDTAGRRTSRKDQLGASTSFGYDFMNNLISLTNRRGQQATYGYDALNRLTTERYADATVTRSYDANSRLKQAVDSVSGTFSMNYDAIGNIIQQVGPFGEVNYTRDSKGRVATRQVMGDPQIGYSFDANGNLTKATMGTATVTRTYDVRNHLSATGRTNGVNGAYSYDATGRLLSIAEQNGATSIVSRSYIYDSASRIISQAEESGLPLATPASSSSFAANNQITSGGALASTFTTDADGNRLTDVSTAGTTSYTWDARGRLKSVSAAGTVTSFLYDFLGNLIQKQVTTAGNTSTEHYVLDDLTNVAKQEKVGVGTVPILTGRRLDQHWALLTGGSPVFPLTDILTSTVALTDSNGNVVGHAYYEPFGKTTESGSTAPIEFTDRQQAAPDLYYYRARYLDVRNGRFISEDPSGLAGGDPDLYRYVGNNPVSRLDPTGLWTLQLGDSVNIQLGPINIQGFFGFAVDGHGGFGIYSGYGGGLGAGADAGAGVSVGFSTGDTIKDLGGPFVNGSGSLGAGIQGSIDGFGGTGTKGQPVVGGGFTLGFGAGADASATVTNTNVQRIW